jgi:hypothetical protein
MHVILTGWERTGLITGDPEQVLKYRLIQQKRGKELKTLALEASSTMELKLYVWRTLSTPVNRKILPMHLQNKILK